MSPSLTSGTLMLQASPAEAWQVWAAFAPVIAAVVAALIAAAALWQRRRADNRAEWWNRTQWALDAALSGDPARTYMGLHVVRLQARSRLATDEELSLLDVAWQKPVQEAKDARVRETAAITPPQRIPVSPGQESVQTAAAQLRVTLDERLGRVTPEWVKELATGKTD